MKRSLLYAVLVMLLFNSCTSSRVITTWKVTDTYNRHYNKLMVAAILGTTKDSIKQKVEDAFAAQLYNRFPAVARFHRQFSSSTSNFSDQSATFVSLCNEGVDAVLTIALVDGRKCAYNEPGNLYTYPAEHYFNRVWSYQQLVAPLAGDSLLPSGEHFWEVILFDLNTLQATAVLQLKTDEQPLDQDRLAGLALEMTRRLRKERLLGPVIKTTNVLKPF